MRHLSCLALRAACAMAGSAAEQGRARPCAAARTGTEPRAGGAGARGAATCHERSVRFRPRAASRGKPDLYCKAMQLARKRKAAAAEMSSQETIYRQFAARAAATPDATAVVCSGRSLTYAEIDHRARTLASGLQRLGV